MFSDVLGMICSEIPFFRQQKRGVDAQRSGMDTKFLQTVITVNET